QRWTRSIRLGGLPGFNSPRWSIVGIGNCQFALITSEKICRRQRMKKCGCGSAAATSRTAFGLSKNENANANFMTTRWSRKDLLGLRELSAEEINFILETTDAFKQVGTREIKKVPALRGKTLVNFFVEPSTRTRTSFELAAFRLSADVINI